jgi:ABC-type glycerol-3-phosphate transport system permease component
MTAAGSSGRALRLRAGQRWPVVAGMLILSASAFFPLYVMISNGFRTNQDWADTQIGLPTTLGLGAFRRAWEGASIGDSFVNSVEISVGTVILSIVVATMAAYACAKIRWRLRREVFLFLLVWIVVPPLVLLVPVYIELSSLPLLHTNLLNSKFGIVLVYTAVNLPFNMYLMTAYFSSLPDELLEAARIDGANVPQTFVFVMVPLARPALATLAIFNFLWAWNEFMFALFILTSTSTKPLTVAVQQLQGRFDQDPTGLMAGLCIATLPVIGVYLVFQRHLVRAITAGVGK